MVKMREIPVVFYELPVLFKEEIPKPIPLPEMKKTLKEVKIKKLKSLPQIKVKKKHKPRKRKHNREWIELRASLLEENKYRCEECGDRAKYVHHIKPISKYPELQLMRINLVVLCIVCHRSKHPELPDILFKEPII